MSYIAGLFLVSAVLVAGIIAALARTPRSNHSNSARYAEHLRQQRSYGDHPAVPAGFGITHSSPDTEKGR